MAPGLWLPPQRAGHEAVSSGRTNLRRIFPIYHFKSARRAR